ncbi:MAG TPA: branched-chain amino acid ABC transporter substrate-binding protein [Anaerolineales bacterium]|nr:branched-chain amino acid ABC transporter substrate-binding protein [Anaerolineales bacterium]
MFKRTNALLALLVLVSLVLAACTTPATEAPVPTEAPMTEVPATEATGTEAPATEAAGPFECDDAIGCVDIAEGEPIHIAYALVVSGPNESLGVDSRNAVEIAIDDIGGEILGHPVRFDGEDEGCSAEGGQAAATKLAADPTIVAVIGTNCSSAARVALPLIDQAGFVMISSSNTAPDLTEPGSDNNFVPAYARVAHNDNLQGRVAAEYVFNELGLTTAATIHDGSLYADQLQQVFAARFQELGGTITAQEAVSPDQTDMSSVLSSIAAGTPEFIYFPIFMPAGAFIIRQVKQTPGLEDVPLMGADGLYSPDVIEGAAEDVEGFMVSSPANAEGVEAEYAEKHQAKFGGPPPSTFHLHAYDSFMIIKNAIEAVAVEDADGTLHIGRQALRDAVHATEGHEGLTGVLSCNETVEPVKYPGDCAAAGIGIWEYHFGEFGPPANPELIWTPE